MKKFISSIVLVSAFVSVPCTSLAEVGDMSIKNDKPLFINMGETNLYDTNFNDYGIRNGSKLMIDYKSKSSVSGSWQSLPSKMGVSINKDWTVTFSDIVSLDKIDGMVIEKIKDKTFIPVRIHLSPTAKQAKVTPIDEYIQGEEYMMKIFLSNGKNYKMSFKVEEEKNLSSNRGNSAGNIANGGYAAQDNGWIYYRNQNDEGKLYKVKVDGTENRKLSNNKASYINIMDGWIYFKSDYQINKIRIDGTDEKGLYSSIGVHMNIVDNMIYSSNNYNEYIYSSRLDGTKEDIIKYSRDIGSMNVEGEYIYYSSSSNDNKLVKMNIADEKDIIIVDKRVEYINVIDESIFFIDKNDSRVYKADKNGHDLTRLNDVPSKNLNVHGKYMYYTNELDRAIYRQTKDGSSSAQKLNDMPSSHINIVNNGIFYLNAIDGIMYKMNLDGGQHSKVDFK